MSTQSQIPHPEIVSQEEWLAERKKLLAEEKELTRQYDRLNARRRRLPMVKVDKTYVFEGPEGNVTLKDLFGDKRQLIVYHFMFAPDWEEGCPGCTGFIDALGDLSELSKRDTHMVIVSRAPLPKLLGYKEKHGWTLPWYSSSESDFNYDYHVTLDPEIAPMEYNYRTSTASDAGPGDHPLKAGEFPGTSVFFLLDGEVYHTYSTFARGGESLTDSYRLLDITPYGRQEDFEDSPEGWPQRPTYG